MNDRLHVAAIVGRARKEAEDVARAEDNVETLQQKLADLDLPEALARYSVLDLVRLAGAQGVELVNWLVTRGALPGGFEFNFVLGPLAAAVVMEWRKDP